MSMVPVRYRVRNFRLGAEELIELGQVPRTAALAPLPTAAPAAPAQPPAARTVVISPEEGRLIVRVVENMIAFAKANVIEYISYCPEDRWQATMRQVIGLSTRIDQELKSKATQIMVPADAVFRLVDLEKCISAARDARLSSGRLALYISAGGAIASTLLGISWLSVPAYLASIAIVLGRPLYAKYQAEPQEPYKPSLSGDDCKEPELGDHTDKAKILERVVLSPMPRAEEHHWGTVRPTSGPVEAGVCLAKDRYRVRVEGWTGDAIAPKRGWEEVPLRECEARNEIAVWEPCGMEARTTVFGPVPEESGHEETFWIEYVGPLTGGTCRRAGPFG